MGYGSTVVEYSTHNSKINGLNPAAGFGREKMVGENIIADCTPVAQW